MVKVQKTENFNFRNLKNHNLLQCQVNILIGILVKFLVIFFFNILQTTYTVYKIRRLFKI